MDHNISLEQMIKAMKLMKCDKASGTSLIIASGEEGAQQIRDPIQGIIRSKQIPTDRKEITIVSLYKGRVSLSNEEIIKASSCLTRLWRY